jgi:hypothetical protein
MSAAKAVENKAASAIETRVRFIAGLLERCRSFRLGRIVAAARKACWRLFTTRLRGK